MARRITQPTRSTHGDSDRPIKIEKPERNKPADKSRRKTFTEVMQDIRDLIHDQRFRIAVAVLLATITLMLLIACISFFFTGANDFSIIEQQAERQDMRTEITNALGLPGAIIAKGLIDGAFGIVVLLPILLLGVYAARLAFEFPIRGWKLLFITLFCVLWGAIVLGFAQQLTGVDTFFRWGGGYGQFMAQWLTSYIQWLGLLIVLIATLIIFLIVIDRHFIDNCRRFGHWCKNLFRKRNNDENNPDSPDNENNGDNAAGDAGALARGNGNDPDNEDNASNEGDIPLVITLDTPTDDTPAPQPQGNEIVIDINPAPEVEVIDNDNNPTGDGDDDVRGRRGSRRYDDNENNEGDAPLDIDTPKDVELTEQDPDYLLHKLGPYDPRKDLENYHFPKLDLLKVYDNETAPIINQEEQQANANRIVTALRNFDIEIESIKATVGPTVTLYEIVPKAGIRISKIQNLENDIMLALSAKGIRIIAPMPGKGTIGIEVPNEKPQVVSMHSVIASKRFQEEQKMRLPIALGRTITNEVFLFDLAKTPHLLVAGATGQGKSVAINAIITSLLYKKHPAELKFVLVDPKMVEFAPYKPLMRHYLAAMPDVEEDEIIITDCDKVINTLNSLVIEMENRYKLLMDAGVRNLEDYNDKFINRRLNPEKLIADSLHHRYLPYIVIIIDEYGDFIMQAGKQVETPIARITQKARAVGMHMILATQRPSVNIVTGVIKANIPTRIALRTQSVIDSRTVLDTKGAEQLIGRGDLLYSGNSTVTRIQCAFVDTPEVDKIVDAIKDEQHYFEPYQLPEYIPEGAEDAAAPGSVDMKRLDPMFADVARYVVAKQEGSTSRLQRAFEIGYNRAGKLSDQLEAAGIVGPNKGPKGRDVLIQDMDALEQKLQDLGAI